MSEEQPALEPDEIGNWEQWGRQQGVRWSEWGKQFGERAQTWGSEAWSSGRPSEAPPPARWSRLVWNVVGLPGALIGAALCLGLAALGIIVVAIGGALAAWLAMGIISGSVAGRRGYPGQLGALFGFALGPIGLLIVRRLPQRR